MTQRQIVCSIQNSERVDFTHEKYFKTVKTSILISIIISCCIAGASVFYLGINLYSGIVVALLLAFNILAIKFLRKHVMTSAIKGGTFIAKKMNNKTFVISINAVSKVKSYFLFGTEFTILKFNMDGSKRKALIIHRTSHFPASIDHCINKAKHHYKKQKANHKPGSVTL